MRRLVLIAALLLISTPARAGDSLLFTGAEVGGHRSAYGQLGMITTFPGSTFGNGWAMRGVVDGLLYKYDQGGMDVDADALGAQLTAGYQSSGAPGWWSFFTGPVYRYTSLSPNDPGNRANGSDFSWIVQGEAERRVLEDFKINLSGNYLVAGNDAFWTRVRLLYRVDGEMYAGPEGVWQGDNEYQAWQVGAGLFGIELNKNAMLGIKGGIRKSEDYSASPYGGFELGYKF